MLNRLCKKRESSARKARQNQKEQPTPKTPQQLKDEEIIVADYQKQHTFEDRLQDSIECKQKHPDCVPLIIERHTDHNDIKQLENCKFLFHAQSQTAQAMVRTQKDVQAKTMWFFVHMPNNQLKMIYPQSKLGVLYQRYRRSDDKNLVNTTSTFMNVMQILCVILMIIYGYLYFFGIESILTLFGYKMTDIIQMRQQEFNNSTSTTPGVDPSVTQGSDKIEL